jgi:hypothetical protein
LVLDRLAAEVGEDGRPADQARAVLLTAVGRESSDTAAVRSHAEQDYGPILSNGVGEPPTGSNFKRRAGKVSEESVAREAFSDFGILRSGKSSLFRGNWRLRTPKT